MHEEQRRCCSRPRYACGRRRREASTRAADGSDLDPEGLIHHSLRLAAAHGWEGGAMTSSVIAVASFVLFCEASAGLAVGIYDLGVPHGNVGQS